MGVTLLTLQGWRMVEYNRENLHSEEQKDCWRVEKHLSTVQGARYDNWKKLTWN